MGFLVEMEHWELRSKNREDFSVQFSRCRVWLFATPWTAAWQASLSIPTVGAYLNSCPSSWTKVIFHAKDSLSGLASI